MAIQVNGTTVIDNSRALTNISSVDATTVAALGAAGVGGAAAGELGGPFSSNFTPSTMTIGGQQHIHYPTNGAFWLGSTIYMGAYRNQIDGNARSIIKSTDSGATWTNVFNWQGSSDTSWSQTHNNFKFAWDGGNNAIYMIGDYYGGIVRTTDGGSSWSVSTPFGNGVYGNFVVSLGGGYFMTYNGNGLYRSSNNGASWSYVTGTTYYSAACYGNTLLLTDGSSNIWRVTNPKTSFSPVQSTGSIYYLDQMVTNGSGLWVTSGGRYSTDDGLTWNNETNVPDTANNTIVYVNGLFIATSHEYYATTTNGQTWTYYAGGLSGGSAFQSYATNVMPPSGWSETKYRGVRSTSGITSVHEVEVT